jgi:hypothetical protein
MGRVTRPMFALAVCIVLAACGSSGPAPGPASSTTPPRTTGHGTEPTSVTSVVPRFAHIVVVIEENRAYSEVIGNAHAPYINGLAQSGALLTRSYGIRHPSEPNYLALFSGSTQGLTDDSCPHRYGTSNLGAQLRARSQAFAGYAESLPYAGYPGCFAGTYVRRHAPWTNFSNLPATVGKPMTAFPSDYSRLPRVSFVVPNLNHDMHDGTVGQADRWLQSHVGGFATWSRTHNSLLILTWDEDDRSAGNRIPSLFAGAHVKRGHYDGRVDHYTMLRTIEAACGLPALGAAANRSPITATWLQ